MPKLSSVLLGVLSLVGGCRDTPPPRSRPAPAAAPVASPSPTPVPAPVPPLSPNARTEDERNTIAVFKRAAGATVFVTQTRIVVDYLGGAEEVPAGSGSGFVWDGQGHIVTNYHVIAEARSLTVTFQDQKTVRARVVGVEPRKDIAVLAVDVPTALLHPLPVRSSGQPEVGQKVIAIGNPFGLDHTLTTGVVSAIGRQVDGIGGVTIRDMIQTDAAINPGNSGGPLLDSAGELIGMNTMIFSKSGSSAGIGFAVPATTIARVVPQIIKHGRAEQLGVGVQIDPSGRIERRLGLAGVIVLAVVPGSPAERAGLAGIQSTDEGPALGDVIVGIDGQPVASYDDLYNGIDRHQAGDRVRLEVSRGRSVRTVETELVVTP